MAKNKKAPQKKRSKKPTSATQISRVLEAMNLEVESAITAAKELDAIPDRYAMVGQARTADAYRRGAAYLAYVAQMVAYRAGQLAAAGGK